jgi:hypothetical protein
LPAALALAVLLLAQGAWAQVIDVGADASDPNNFYQDNGGSDKSRPCVINKTAQDNCNLSSDGNLITISGGTWTLTGTTGNRTIKVTGKADIYLENVIVASSVAPPLSIETVSGTEVNIYIKRKTKNQFMGGGYGAAGIHLASTASVVIDDDANGTGESGELHAKGAGAFAGKNNSGDGVTNGGGAGIGANGACYSQSGKCFQYGSACSISGTINVNNTTLRTSMVASTPGNLTIKGGKVFAFGGFGIVGSKGNCNTNSMACGGGGAGIGGGGGFASNSAPNGACSQSNGINNLNISGGTIVVRGGSINLDNYYNYVNGIGIGQSVKSGSNDNTTIGNSGLNSGFTITGGSLTAIDSIGPTATGIANASSNRYELRLGSEASPTANNLDSRTRNRHLIGCNFGTGTRNGGNVPTDNTCITGTGTAAYGINSVYTDDNGKVYFWFSSSPFSTPNSDKGKDTIALEGVPNHDYDLTGRTGVVKYGYDNASGNIRAFRDPFAVPTMTYPNITSYSLVGDKEDTGENGTFRADTTKSGALITGPYRTEYRAVSYQQVAAVGHPVKVYKGTTMRNSVSADSDLRYTVRWFRTSTRDGDYAEENSRALATEQAVGVNKDCFDVEADEIGSEDCQYIPKADDYGKFIWAEVMVRGVSQGNNGTCNSVANTNSNCGDTWLDPGAKVSSVKAMEDVAIYPLIQVGVVVKAETVPNPRLGITDGGTVSIFQGGVSIPDNGLVTNVKAPLTFIVDGAKNGTELVTDIGHSWTYKISDGKGGYSTPSTIAMTDPKANLLFTLLDGLNNDIIFTDNVKNGSTPSLKTVQIFREGVTDKPTAEGSSETGFVMVGNVPKKGTIKLIFDQNITNITTGTVFLSKASDNTEAKIAPADNNSDGNDEASYTYGITSPELAVGEAYLLDVSNFMSSNEMSIMSRTARFTVEKPASFTKPVYAKVAECLPAGTTVCEDSTQMRKEFLIGETRKATVRYEKNQGGEGESYEYYWEVSNSNSTTTSQWDASAGIGHSSSSGSMADSSLHTIETPELDDPDYFGKYIRLVVRPTGTESVDGSKVGEVVFGEWMQIGVFLEAKYIASPEPDNKYENVQFRTCVATEKTTVNGVATDAYTSDVIGCYRTGYVVFSSEYYVNLTTITKDDDDHTYMVNNWTITSVGGGGEGVDYTLDLEGNPHRIKLIAPTVERYRINPVVVESKLPQVSELNILTTSNPGGVNIVDGSNSQDAIKEGNTLTVKFNQNTDLTNPRNSIIIRKDKADGEDIGATFVCANADVTTCTINLFNGSTTLLEDNKTYSITISGFQNSSTKESMPRAYYSFGTFTGTTPVNVTFTKADSVGTMNYNGGSHLSGADEGTKINTAITGYTLSVNDANVCLDFTNASFKLEGVNAGKHKVEQITNLVLGSMSNGKCTGGSTIYRLGDIIGQDYLTATINALPLWNLAADSTTLKNGTNCKVSATATYGDLLTEVVPYSNCNLTTDGGLFVSGTWELCTPPLRPGDVCKAGMVPNGVGTPGNANQLYAYFTTPEGSNYEWNTDGKVLMMKVNTTVNKKKISVVADLVDLGNLGYGIKTYDGSNTITGNVYASPDTASGYKWVEDSDMGNIKGTAMKFISPASNEAGFGSNKVLEITWDLGDAASKYDLLEVGNKTRTIGTIAKRPVYITGLDAKSKYYDGKIDAEVTTGSHGVQTNVQAIAECDTITNAVEKAECQEINKYVGSIAGHTLTVTGSASEYEFLNPNAGTDRAVLPKKGSTLGLSGTNAANYEMRFKDLKADIYPATVAHYVCSAGTECNSLKTDTNAVKTWLANATNQKKVVEKLMTLGPAENPASYVDVTYGDTYSSVSDKLGTVLPTKLTDVMGAAITNPTSGSWTWVESGFVPNASETPVNKMAIYRHNDPNYASVEIPVPMKVAQKQLEFAYVNAKGRPFAVCFDGHDPKYDGSCLDDVAREVDLTYELLGVVGDDHVALKVVGQVDDRNAGVRNVSIRSVDWSGAENSNYYLPNNDYPIAPVTIGKAEYPVNPPSPITDLPLLYNSNNALVYDKDKYPNLSMIGFAEDAAGWVWVDNLETLPNPQSDASDYRDVLKDAEFTPTGGHDYGSNYRPKEGKVALRVYKRSENNRVKGVPGIDSPCGADSARITVVAEDPYATVWFNNTQYYKNESTQNEGTFLASGLEYGNNRIYYRIRPQAYGDEYAADHIVHHPRRLPFSSVASWVRNKSLTVKLDSSKAAEKSFFGRYGRDFDLNKTLWFKGSDSVGIGMVLPVVEGSGDYSLVLFTKSGQAFSSCKESGAYPELPKPLEDLVPIVPKTTLVASSFGSRVVAGGTSLVFNTPNGGTVSIYTMKGELISKMVAVDNRTTVRVPSTRGMYIVKLEAK